MLFQTYFKQISNISVNFLNTFHPHSFCIASFYCKSSILNYLHFKVVERRQGFFISAFPSANVSYPPPKQLCLINSCKLNCHLATVWEAGKILLFFFCPVNNARFCRFPLDQISRNLNKTTSIGKAVQTFGTEFCKFRRKGSLFPKNA